MKKYFLTGLGVLLPLAVTLIIVVEVLDLITAPFIEYVERALLYYENKTGVDVGAHPSILMSVSRLIALVVLLLLIFLLGFLGRRLFFHSLMNLTDQLFKKIPFVKTVYTLTAEVAKVLFSHHEKPFKETVLIPFPTRATYALGFVTGTAPESLRKVVAAAELAVFLPTAPHPMSGYVLFSPRADLVSVDMTTEETFRFLLSCGTAFPDRAVHPTNDHPSR